MKLFETLMSKIFGQASPPAATTSSPAGTSAPVSGTSAGAGSAGASATATMAPVDVDAVLTQMAAKNPERLDWKKSIVDLMKLVGMDASLQARKQLATELGYTGDKNDSATMNIWLHKQVLKKLAENGGKVPQNLLD
jgi:hypothetical protein